MQQIWGLLPTAFLKKWAFKIEKIEFSIFNYICQMILRHFNYELEKCRNRVKNLKVTIPSSNFKYFVSSNAISGWRETEVEKVDLPKVSTFFGKKLLWVQTLDYELACFLETKSRKKHCRYWLKLFVLDFVPRN